MMKRLNELPRWFCKPFDDGGVVGAKMVKMEVSNARWIELDAAEQLVRDSIKELKAMPVKGTMANLLVSAKIGVLRRLLDKVKK